MIHIPVLQNEVLEYLNPKKDENFIDCTFGAGGHSQLIISRTLPNGKILGIEASKELSDSIQDKRIKIINDSYINIKEIIERENFYPFSGILFDFGMSSWHIDESKKGFSFLKDEPLDMRYGEGELTAEKIINNYHLSEIEEIIKEYGEERFAKKIALKIIEKRKEKTIKKTFDLVEIIKEAVPSNCRKQRIHFATRTFQALRIEVNDELNNIKKGISSAIDIIPKGGRIVAISFHSLEDRIVKNIFRDSKDLKILTKKPIIASDEEIRKNQRSRSAKLRAVIKI